MSLIIVEKEKLLELLKRNVSSWYSIETTPNFDAYEFDPNTVNVASLKADGYYEDRLGWVAGLRIKELEEYMDVNVLNAPDA